MENVKLSLQKRQILGESQGQILKITKLFPDYENNSLIMICLFLSASIMKFVFRTRKRLEANLILYVSINIFTVKVFLFLKGHDLSNKSKLPNAKLSFS